MWEYFRFRRRPDGGHIGRAALRLHAPSASASLRAAYFADVGKSMSLLLRGAWHRTSALRGLPVNAWFRGGRGQQVEKNRAVQSFNLANSSYPPGGHFHRFNAAARRAAPPSGGSTGIVFKLFKF